VSEIDRFFCGGLPKSGTTFLQRALDLHPEISCPSEHNLEYLFKLNLENLKKYNHVYLRMATNFGIKTKELSEKIILENFIDLISKIFENTDENKRIKGLNDNNFLLNNTQLLLNFFESSKIILIFRNPIDRACSAWRYNQRLYEIDGNIAHIDLLKTNDEMNLELFVERQTSIWITKFQELKKIKDNNEESIFFLSYEDLVTKKREMLQKLLSFLKLDHSEQVISDIEKLSTIDSMRNNSSSKFFYYKGDISFGKSDLSDIFIKKMLDKAEEGIDFFNYKQYLK